MNSCNSGVEGGSGYSFQRCCVAFLLLEEFDEINSKNYFICIEHHDDFLFAYINEKGQVLNIDAFQAKKSSNDWSINNDLCEIIEKITQTGKNLLDDPITKTDDYNHSLSFITNKSINLKSNKNTENKTEIIKIQASNNNLLYTALPSSIRTKIEKSTNQEKIEKNQLEKLKFRFIDLPQTHKGWLKTLKGSALEHFKDSVTDHEAIIYTLLQLLEEYANQHNNSNRVLLSDKSKKIDKKTINETFRMFQQKKKTFELWREKSKELSRELNIKLAIQHNAKELIDNCFEYFKDITQIDYREIYRFVEARKEIDEKHTDITDCIIELYHLYIKEHEPRLEKHMVAFSIIAAYVETRGMHVHPYNK